MENSRKSNSTELTHKFAKQLSQLIPPHSSILVAFSGGVDSVVLLDLLHRFAPRFSWQLSAVHVHHGISTQAGVWADFCEQSCIAYRIPFHLEKVDISPLRALGVEAAARQLRYEAFARHRCDFLVMAHHADDQAETLMLQLLRGSGVRGVSAMPVLSPLAATTLIRPLLSWTRNEIVSYATAIGLGWIDDESNADEDYPRNYLRHRVMPEIGFKFPSYRETLARSAQHFAEASMLLDELARLDAQQLVGGGQLNVAGMCGLSWPRAKNLFRTFLLDCGAPTPHSAQLEMILNQLCGARNDADVCVDYAGWQVRRFRGEAYVMQALPQLNKRLQILWTGENQLDWPMLGRRIGFDYCMGNGICLHKLNGGSFTLQVRKGGERIKPQAHGANRTLKNLFQEHDVPPWLRDRLPLLYCDSRLVCVMGIAVDADFQANEGEPGMSIRWLD